MLKAKGFTLVEMMVAVFVSSIVVIAAYALMDGTRERLNALGDTNIGEANIRNAEQLIKRDISRIGYHVPVDHTITDSNDPSTSTVYPCKGSGSTTRILDAFSFGRASSGDKFDTMVILADITDYDGFTITGGNTSSLNVEQSIDMPYVAADFTKPAANRIHHRATGTTEFGAIFNRAFQYAYAAYIESPTNQGIITPLGANKAQTNGSSSTVAVDLNSNYAKYGFTGTALNPFEGAKVFPIVAIVYKVASCGSVNCLYRCYGDPFASQNSAVIAHRSDCQIVLENVTKFDVVPLDASHPSLAAYTEPISNERQSIDLKDLKGVAFQIEVNGSEGFHVVGTSYIKTNISTAASGVKAYSSTINGVTVPTS